MHVWERGFGKCEVELQRINDRLDRMGKAVIFGAISLTGGIFAGLGGTIVLMAIQL